MIKFIAELIFGGLIAFGVITFMEEQSQGAENNLNEMVSQNICPEVKPKIVEKIVTQVVEKNCEDIADASEVTVKKAISSSTEPSKSHFSEPYSERFFNESVDESWALKTEETIRYYLSKSLATHGGSIGDLDCRTSACRLVLNTDGGGSLLNMTTESLKYLDKDGQLLVVLKDVNPALKESEICIERTPGACED